MTVKCEDCDHLKKKIEYLQEKVNILQDDILRNVLVCVLDYVKDDDQFKKIHLEKKATGCRNYMKMSR